MTSRQAAEGDDCGLCGHPFNPHIFVATAGDPMAGGLVFCQDPECECIATWGVQGDRPPMPSPEVVAEIRAAVFGRG